MIRTTIIELDGHFNEEECKALSTLSSHFHGKKLILGKHFTYSSLDFRRILRMVESVDNRSSWFGGKDGVIYDGDSLFYYPKKCRKSVFILPARIRISDVAIFRNDFLKEMHIRNGNCVNQNYFTELSSLEKIVIDGKSSKYFTQDGVLYIRRRNREFVNYKESYPSGVYLVCFPCNNPNQVFSIPDFVTHIAPCAFANSNVKAVKFPKRIKSIGDKAFINCRNLTTIVIPNVFPNEVGKDIFEGCEKLYYIKTMSEDAISEEVLEEWRSLYNGHYKC